MTEPSTSSDARARTALIIAHPGHELRVHHWIEEQRPLVFVLTQGDGHAGTSRLGSTTRVLDRAGAHLGAVYGRWRDQDLYQALLAGQHGAFLDTVDDICAALEAHDIDHVVADAEERYNPSHDVCRYLASAVVAQRAAAGRTMVDLEFPLVGAPDALLAAASGDSAAVVLHLDREALARKLEAAHEYPEMAGEVARALARFGPAAFATECLTPVRDRPADDTAPPFYETHGAAQVAAGRYREVLRYGQHVQPLRVRLAEATASCRQVASPGR